MFKALLARARQGYRTANYPAHDPVLPALFRGRPVLDADLPGVRGLGLDDVTDHLVAVPSAAPRPFAQRLGCRRGAS